MSSVVICFTKSLQFTRRAISIHHRARLAFNKFASQLPREVSDSTMKKTNNHLGRSVQTVGMSENTFTKYLIPEDVSSITPGKEHIPRQVYHAHYTPVRPAGARAPYLVATSPSCAMSLNLDTAQLETEEFLSAMAGNTLLPGLDQPYCTVYGCHCYGTWFGQLGDGRAVTLGEIHVAEESKAPDQASGGESEGEGPKFFKDSILGELQLKGGGRSPYSRGFDGKAVLRSCVREFIG